MGNLGRYPYLITNLICIKRAPPLTLKTDHCLLFTIDFDCFITIMVKNISIICAEDRSVTP
jgi:hypothetical protein